MIDELSGLGVTTLVLRDFDAYGLGILHTSRTDSKRHRFKNEPLVEDLGLRLQDVQNLNLPPERMAYGVKVKKDPRIRLARYGATKAERDYLVTGKDRNGQWVGQRVELNRPSAAQLLRFIEDRFAAFGVKKVVPDEDPLALAYQRAVRVAAVQQAADQCIQQANHTPVTVPDGLTAVIQAKLTEKPALSWDTAIFEIAKANPAVGK